MTYLLMAAPIASRSPLTILVGEAPAPSWDRNPRHLLAGPPFRRLAEEVFWPGNPRAWSLYLESFLRCNVVQRKLAPGERWPAAEARSGADAIVRTVDGRWPIVVLGRRAATALGIPRDREFLSVSWIGTRCLVLLPHPSGRCRLWNDPGFRTQVQDFFSDFWKSLRVG